MALCHHRVNTDFMPARKVVEIKGRAEQRVPRTLQEAYGPGQHVLHDPEPISRLRLAINTFRLYRRVRYGLRESFRNAWRAYRKAN